MRSQAIEAAKRELGLPASVQINFQGAALAFRASLNNELWLILAAIVTMYIVLGVLYESFIHPITILSTLPSAGVGALLALMLTGNDLSIIAIIGIILLIGIVKKNAIMMIDFALDAERERGHGAARRDLPGVPAALPADHDDDDGGDPRRAAADDRLGRGLRAAAPARHHDGRRPDLLAGADALHHAGDLSGVRSARPPRRSAPAPRARRTTPAHAADGGSAMNLSAPFIDRPVATTLLTLGVALAGAIAFRLLPVSPLPQVDFPTISVQASLPGASPETMAATVATPLERSLGRIAGVTEMTSSSSLGSTRITLQFDLSRTSTAPRATCRRRSTPRATCCRRACPAIRRTAR